MVFYNEIDRFNAEWLRELIKARVIAPGVVDERDVRDIRPDELMGYTQCHFFAGIGGWSYALRLAGWGDDRPVWTGSCPCQPFSAAGKRGGFTDERHLWPAFFHLIRECRPVMVFGEQVASNDGLAWLDLVQSDLEGEGYAVGPLDICAAGFGSPHIRQRLYFVADRILDDSKGTRRIIQHTKNIGTTNVEINSFANPSNIQSRFVADLSGKRCRKAGVCGERSSQRVGISSKPGSVAESTTLGRRGWGDGNTGWNSGEVQVEGSGATNGFWANAVWLPCRDGKARPVEPVSEPLADEFPGDLGLVRLERRAEGEEPGEEVIVYAPLVARSKNRVGRLRGYGNAIVAEQAAGFIRAYIEKEAK